MDSDNGKIFIGGISWDTNEERLKEYFSSYGHVVDVVIMKDRTTGRARGFGFVVFSDPAVVDRVITEKHNIDGRAIRACSPSSVEAKRVVPREEQQNSQRTNNSSGPRTKKIFVGGLAPTVTEEDFRKYFEAFGNITDVVVMYDHTTQRHRGFGFITYDSEDAVDKVLQQTFHELKEKNVEVKRAVPKEMSAGNNRGSGGRGPSYPATTPYMQGYAPPLGAYGAQPPIAGAAYPPYGAAPGYGPTAYAAAATYGASMNGGYAAAPVYGAAGFAGAPAGSYGTGFSSTPGNAGYGSATSGYAAAPVPAQYGSAPIPARTGWGPTAGSPGYPAPGGGSWGGAPPSGQPAAAGNYGYGNNDGSYGSRNDGAYVQGSGGYASSAGGYVEAHSGSGYGNS